MKYIIQEVKDPHTGYIKHYNILDIKTRKVLEANIRPFWGLVHDCIEHLSKADVITEMEIDSETLVTKPYQIEKEK